MIASNTVDCSYSFRQMKEGKICMADFSVEFATKELVAAVNSGCQFSMRRSSVSGGMGIFSGAAIA